MQLGERGDSGKVQSLPGGRGQSEQGADKTLAEKRRNRAGGGEGSKKE